MNGIVHLAIFVGPQVEYVDLFLCAFDHQQHGVETILNVEIGFSLVAVSEHVEPVGIGTELFEEIKDMPVRVALAENRHKAKDVTLESETLAVGLNQAFAGQLRRAIQRRLDGEGRVFRRWKDLGLPVD